MENLAINLLGRPQLFCNQQEITIKQRKAWGLLAYIAVSSSRQTRERLTTLLWPEANRKTGAAYLRQTLWQLNKVLPAGVLQTDRQAVSLQPVALDVHQFQTSLDGDISAELGGKAVLPKLEAALKLYRDAFMAGFSVGDSAEFDTWQTFQAEKLQRQRIQIYSRLVKGYTEQRAFEAAIWHAKQWLLLDPLLEEAHRMLMRLFVATGRRQLALDQFEICQAALRVHGAQPSPETSRLFQVIQRGEALPELGSTASANAADALVARHAQDAATQKANVQHPQRERHASTAPFLAPPKPPYQIVGRDTLLEGLKARLFEGGAPTQSALRGLPGVGKTAVAVELAHDPEVVQHFYDGVLWAGLGREPDVFAQLGHWAIALGVNSREVASRKTLQDRQRLLTAVIGQKRMLLVVDDAWRSADALAFLVGGDECHYLVTTRQPAVGAALAGKQLIELTELNESDGLALLMRIVPNVLKADRLLAIELVRAVGGLPLALILIGRYLHKIGYRGRLGPLKVALQQLQETKARLQLEQPMLMGHHPTLLTETSLSLAAAIAMSEAMLDASAKEALHALAVFPPKPNTFSAEAAEFVTNALPGDLDVLVEHGLVEVVGTRYTLHQTIADYGLFHLSNHQVYARFVSHFVSYLKTEAKQHEQFRLEATNCLAALDLAHAHDMHLLYLQGVHYVADFLLSQGSYDLAAKMLTQAEQVAQEQNDDLYLAYILGHQSSLSCAVGDVASAELAAREGLRLARRTESQTTICDLLIRLGSILIQYQGAHDEGMPLIEEGIDISRALEDDPLTSRLLLLLGASWLRRGNKHLANEYYRDGLNLARKHDHKAAMSAALNNLGTVAWYQSDFQAAEAYWQEALSIGKEIGYSAGMVLLLQNLGILASTHAQVDVADAYFDEALAISRRIGHMPHVIKSLSLKGESAEVRNDLVEAERLHREGYELAKEVGLKNRISHALLNLGVIDRKKKRYEAAEQWMKQGLAIAKEMNDWYETYLLLRELGNVHYAAGDLTSALRVYQEALEHTQRVEDENGTAHILFGLALTHFAQGDAERAEQLGRRSLDLLTNMGHGAVSKVQAWLDNKQVIDPL